MKRALACAVLLYFTSLASAQNIQIQAQPQTVNYMESDMNIVCSITGTQLSSLFFIQLLKNSSTTFETIVSVIPGQTPPVKWKDTQLQGRATATGNTDPPSTAQLKLTIDKASVICPTDFKTYMCKMSGLSTNSDIVNGETFPITISNIVKPAVIEMPRVRILNSFSDTPNRQFPVGTAIQLTCQGEVGNDASKTISWCAQRATEMMFTGLPQTPIHSEASLSGCQYTRSSTITYNLTNQDTFTKFLCESGDTGLCGTGTAIQHVNITIAFAQNIQIQALPQTINYRENDMVIVCSISNPTQYNLVYSIQLQKNSSATFETVVSVASGQTPPIQWRDTQLQGRATATGNVDSPASAQLRFTIIKDRVMCPSDFKMYMCQMVAFSTVVSEIVTHKSSPIAINYIVEPAVIEMPRVRILNENFDTPNRQFPVGTAIQLTCQGEIGSDPSKTIRWCAQRTNERLFTGLPQTPIHSEASQSGCMFTRSSTITYNLTSEDTFTKFLCESGDTGMCGTGTAIQHVNITIEGSGATNT